MAKLTNEVFKHSDIKEVSTDRYPGINFKKLESFLKEIKIPLIFTAAYAPFSKRLSERLNRTLVNEIKCKLNKQKNKIAFKRNVQKLVEDDNKVVHTVTQFIEVCCVLDYHEKHISLSLKKCLLTLLQRFDPLWDLLQVSYT